MNGSDFTETYPILYKQYEVSALNTLSLGFIIYVKIKKNRVFFIFFAITRQLPVIDNHR